jgi:hypothetical protein
MHERIGQPAVVHGRARVICSDWRAAADTANTATLLLLLHL